MRSWFQVWSENHPELWYWDKQKVNFCWILLLKFRIHSVLGLNQVFTYFSKNFIWCYLWKSKSPKSNNAMSTRVAMFLILVLMPTLHLCAYFQTKLLPVHKVRSRLQHSWQKHQWHRLQSSCQLVVKNDCRSFSGSGSINIHINWYVAMVPSEYVWFCLSCWDEDVYMDFDHDHITTHQSELRKQCFIVASDQNDGLF